jgi:hypothetical protein
MEQIIPNRGKLGRTTILNMDVGSLVAEAVTVWEEQAEMDGRDKYPGEYEAVEIAKMVIGLARESKNLTRWVNEHGRLPRLNRLGLTNGEKLYENV